MWQSIKEYIPLSLRRWWGMTIGVIGAVGTVTQLMGYGLPNMPLWAWLIVMFLGFSIAQFLAFHKLRLSRDMIKTGLDSIKNARPCIVLYKTENVLGHVVTRQAGSITSEERPWFTRVQIANEPKTPLQAVDALVAAHISFYDSFGHECFSTMIGRWAETLEIAQGGQPIEIDQINIPPTGRPYILDIGLKYPEEDEFYGYNNETPHKATVGFRDKDRALGPGIYSIKVKLRGKNVDREFWFNLNNQGKGKEVELTEASNHTNPMQ